MGPPRRDPAGLYHLPQRPGFPIGVAVWPILIGVLICLVVWVSATQFLAWRLGYQPALGEPFVSVLHHPVYPPWDWAVWAWRYRKVDALADPLKWTAIAGITGFLIALGCASPVQTNRARKLMEHTDQLRGSAHWASEKDVQESGLLGKAGVYVGAWKDKHGRVNYLRDDTDMHDLVFAPSGSGKGVGFVLPTLLGWGGSAVVYDLKGENYQHSAGYRAQCGHVIFRFAPVDNGRCSRFNPLEEIRLGTTHDVADAQNIAHILMRTGKEPREPYWYDSGESLAVGLILHACYAARRQGRTSNLAEVRSMLTPIGDADPQDYDTEKMVDVPSQTSDTFRRFLRTLLTYDHGTGWWGTGTHPTVAETAQEMLNKKEHDFSGVLSTFTTALKLYKDPVVAVNTSTSDFKVRDLVDFNAPTTLYLVVPPSDQIRTRPLIRLMFTLIVHRLTEEQTENRQRLLFLIDEFPSLGYLDVFAHAMSFMRGYGLKAFLIAQDIRQIVDAYGPNESIVSNCHIRIAYAPNQLDTAQMLSRMTGAMTVEKASFSFSGRRRAWSLSNMTSSVEQVERPLLTADEVTRIPDDAALIFVSGRPPIYGAKIRYFADPVMNERSMIPPPTELVRIVFNHQPDSVPTIQPEEPNDSDEIEPISWPV